MPAKKKITDLPGKSLKPRKAEAVKGGRLQAQRLASDRLSAAKKGHNLNHNQTLRTRA